MRLDILKEKHYSGPVYHITTLDAMKAILISKHFNLTNAMEKRLEKDFVFNEKFPYFFSVSRSRINAVRDQHGGSSGTFVLDMKRLTDPKTTIVKPLNWFTSDGKKNYRTLESEERIWSSKPNLPLDAVMELHVYHHKANSSAALRNSIGDIAEMSHQRGIKCFVYESERAYLLLNKKKTVTYIGPPAKIMSVDEAIEWRENKTKKLLEKHYTGPLYHSTKLFNGAEIVKTNKFELAGYWTDDVFVTFDKSKGYEFYLSVSRSKRNSFKNYHITEMTFVLDSSYFMKKGFKIKPTDYFGDEEGGVNSKESPRRAEVEERIWSRKEVIPADSIVQAHINLKDCVFNRFRYYSLDESGRNKIKIEIMEQIETITRLVHTYIYPSTSSYNMLDTKRALNHDMVEEFIDRLIREHSRVNV